MSDSSSTDHISADVPGIHGTSHEFADLTDAEIFNAHQGGKIATTSRLNLETIRDLSIAYTPGVARVCEAIHEDPSLAHHYTWAGRNVAIITDGTAVLGLGDIGPQAALPVMEGKAQLFQRFVGLNGVPIVLNTTNVDEMFDTICRIAPSFGAINLEDISAPRCFELEKRLKNHLNIPVMHDDQHGTAMVATAALRNACTLLGRRLKNLRVVISGAGAAGVACAKMLIAAGVKDVVVLDSRGIIHPERTPLNSVKSELAEITNPRRIRGGISEALDGADTFIGLCSHWPTQIQKFARNWPTNMVPWWLRAVRTCPTRSTTCWPTRVYSTAR